MKRVATRGLWLGLLGTALVMAVGGCARTYPLLPPSAGGPEPAPRYVIGAGDSLNIFVWRNPEVSTSVTVQSDGTITTPLVEDLPASGKTTTELARDLERVLGVYIRDPIVTVIASESRGPFDRQIRVLGEAASPTAVPYQENMTLVDLMLQVGGLTEFAAGNRASIVRRVNGERKQFTVRIEDLIEDADMSANVDIYPGDILIIPEAFF
jgi:polysaccharide export outer membrane protein